MHHKDKDPRAPKSEMQAARFQLQRAREVAQKEPADLAEFVGGISGYYDLENCDGDLYCAISLGELSRICSALAIKPIELFGGDLTAHQSISPERLLYEAREYMKRNNLSVAEFSDLIGFEIGPAFEGASQVTEWNVDFLRWICNVLSVDWRSALP